MGKRIVIVGGGIIGMFAAYYAAQDGHDVTVVERDNEQRENCSTGNAGMIVPSHFTPLAAPGMVKLGLKWMWNPRSPFYIKPRMDWGLMDWVCKFWQASNQSHVDASSPVLRDLHLASRSLYEVFVEKHGNNIGLVKRGLLMLCKTQHALNEESAAAQKAVRLGILAEVLSPIGTADLEPELSMNIRGSVYYPNDCHLSPQLLMTQLQTINRSLGVKFVWGTEALGWQTQGQIIHSMRTNQGNIAADEYVLCCGSWSPQTVSDLRLNFPMQAGKGYSLTLTQPRQLPSICSILAEARVAVTPMSTTLRFGGTMEFAGLNTQITPARIQGIIDAIPHYLPAFESKDFHEIKPWCGLRPCSPDGLPYLGRTRDYSNLIIATGHAMMGLSLGPISGMLVSEFIRGEQSSQEIDLLSPDRYRKK